MADGGVTEAALIAAAAEAGAGTAAAGGTAAALAAAAPEVIGAGATAAGTAAAAAPVVAEAVPTIAAAVPAAVTTAETSAPIVLGATTEGAGTLLGPAAGETTGTLFAAAPEATTVPSTGLLGSAELVPGGTTMGTTSGPGAGLLGQDIGFGAGNVAPGYSGLGALPEGTSLPVTSAPGATPTGLPGSNLLDKLGTWWGNASLGDKLKVGSSVLGAGSTAAKAATPPPTKGPSRTMQQGKVGQPTGGERALAQIVDSMLKRRDTYLQAQSGVPIAYRPRGLLG